MQATKTKPETPKLSLLTVPISSILVEAQPRKEFAAEPLGGLAASIGASGLLHPLLCVRRGDGYLLIDGERRLRACTELGWTDIAVLVIDDEVTP